MAMFMCQGKTYSMIGPRLGTSAFDKQQLVTDSDGFLARAYANVFKSIEARHTDMHVHVRASCCEVYHEQVLQCCMLPAVHPILCWFASLSTAACSAFHFDLLYQS